MGTEHPLYHEKFAEAVRKPLDGSAVAAMGASRVVSGLLVAVAALSGYAFSPLQKPWQAGPAQFHDAPPAGAGVVLTVEGYAQIL